MRQCVCTHTHAPGVRMTHWEDARHCVHTCTHARGVRMMHWESCAYTCTHECGVCKMHWVVACSSHTACTPAHMHMVCV